MHSVEVVRWNKTSHCVKTGVAVPRGNLSQSLHRKLQQHYYGQLLHTEFMNSATPTQQHPYDPTRLAPSNVFLQCRQVPLLH